MKKVILISTAFLFVFLLNSCSADEIEEQQPQNIDLQKVEPVEPVEPVVPKNDGMSTYKGDLGNNVGGEKINND